ncbi:MAG: aspartate carbamoyltransferase catalytic subunit [Peptococcaceae bacterium]
MPIAKKDLIHLSDLTVEEIWQVLDTAREMKQVLTRDDKKHPVLRGRSVINLFYENSTRTRSSFEFAGKYLGADVVNINTSSSSVMKGESLKDTALTLDRMAPDVIVMRHGCSGAHEILARHVKARVINAGDGAHQHPTQSLLDLLTIVEHKQSLEGLKIAIVGDILHSRVARSDLWGFQALGAEVTLCAPPTLMPAKVAQLGVKVTYNMDEAVRDADVIVMLRIQLERQKSGMFPSIREYAAFYGLNAQRLQLAKPDCLVMHPGPINRGVEITPEVADGVQAVIEEQVNNGLAVRMALLSIMGGVSK